MLTVWSIVLKKFHILTSKLKLWNSLKKLPLPPNPSKKLDEFYVFKTFYVCDVFHIFFLFFHILYFHFFHAFNASPIFFTLAIISAFPAQLASWEFSKFSTYFDLFLIVQHFHIIFISMTENFSRIWDTSSTFLLAKYVEHQTCYSAIL